MALQVWLPLDNNIKNLGLKNVTCTKLGTVNFEDGKIGKAFSRGSERIHAGISLNTNFLDMFNGNKTCSVAVWVKPLGNHVHYVGAILSSGNWNTKNWAFGVYQDNTKVVVLCNGHTTYVTCSVPVNEWTHLVSVYDNRVCKLYKNGVYVASYTANSDFDSDSQITCVGRETYGNGYFGFYGLINDLRIYDHCLSPKEIKEISQGLTVHFPLDFNEYKLTSCTNLVKNGWRGADNWNSSAGIYTDDLPNVTGITQRYGSKNTKEHIEINQDHEYQYSAYVKKIPNSTVSLCYTALDTWDSDGLHIPHLYEPDAFKSNTQTTLAQDLNPGDTLVYLTSTANWQLSNLTYIAIFGYTNSEGYTYPDFTYTRYVYKYSAIDTVNKTVTLNAAYSGEIVPAGTAVCQAIAGNTYYYPNIVNSSTVEDWTLLSKNFIPKNVNRLKYAKYINVATMGGYNYTAGCTLVDLTEGTTVYDSSGFGNNGTITGNMQIDPKSPRYETCMQPLTDNSYISFPTRKFQEFTYSFWVKRDRVSQTNREMIMTGWYGLSFELNPNNTLSFIRSISNTSNFIVTSNTLLNDTSKWYHVVLTKDSSGVSNIYINGVLDKSGTNENNVYYSNDTTKIGIYNGATYQFLGSISDFRIYATTLSENEIKELYDTSTIIDNKGNLHAFEILETNDENPIITKQGQLKTNIFIEPYEYIYLPADKFINVGLGYSIGDKCTAKTIMRYESGGSTRDLMGCSASGSNYWGVTANNTWEKVNSYSNSDITVKNEILYIHTINGTHAGTYTVGDINRLVTDAGVYSTRAKYIYQVTLYKNDILERELYPVMYGDAPGLYDVLHNVFYPCNNNTGVVVGNDPDTSIYTIYKNKIESNSITEI